MSPSESEKVYIPKKETQQSKFIRKHSKYDGRGVKLAIIDGGIDVSLPGLQKTSTGLPKIIDCFELTGNGKVDTSTIRKLDENNFLISLSERKLREQTLNEIISKAEMPENNDEECNKFVDCIVWNDGNKWLSCLITSATNCNDLENVKVLTNFRDEHDYCFLIDKITCCVTISEDGNQLHICTSIFPHGTEVSVVAASNYPNKIDDNGLAPGAQFYFMNVCCEGSYHVQDALSKCVELGDIDIINISVDHWWKNIDILEEMHSKHETIIIHATGNQGPLYSTNWVSNDVNDQVMFIGSLVTSDMYENLTSWKSPLSPSTIVHSSRGPSIHNYSREISFVAPGAAIFPSARWLPENSEIIHGTSIAAPNAAGSIACLLSALKAQSIPYTPAMIKFALSNTAEPLKNVNKLACGNGII